MRDTGASGSASAAASERVMSGAELLLAGAILVGAAGAFSLVARRVATKAAEPVDESVRDAVQARRSAMVDVVVKPVTLLSMPIVVVAGTAALVWWLHHDGRRSAAIAIGLAPMVAATAGQSFTTFLHQRNPPDASDATHGEVTKPSFPSGHTTGVTAEALAIAYVLSSEGIATPEILAALLTWPLLVGVTRVYRDRHWLSDILGGWAAGIAVAAASALLYGSLTRRAEPTDERGAVTRLPAICGNLHDKRANPHET
jgi:membrane-associated phospholipid phosphatase